MMTLLQVLFLLISFSIKCGADDVVAFTKGRVSYEYLSHGEIVTFDKTITNINAHFSLDGKFVCSIPGLYAFHFYAVTKSHEHFRLELYHNEEYIVSIYCKTQNDIVGAGNSVFLNLQIDDKVYIKALENNVSFIFGAGHQVYTTFTGVLVADTNDFEYDAFSVGLHHYIAWTTAQTIPYDRLITSRGTLRFNEGTGTFTASQTGLHIFHYHALSTSDHGLWLHLYHNYHYVNSVYSKTPNGYASAGNTCILMLYGGDEVFVMTRKEGRTYGDNETNQTYTTFSGSTLTPYTDIDDTDDFVYDKYMAFSVGLSTHFTPKQGQTVIYDRVFSNKGSGYDTKSGKFTAKHSGIYVFHFHALSHSDNAIWISLYHNLKYVNSIYGHVSSGNVTVSNSASLQLLPGDEVFLDINSHDTALYGESDQIYCTFSGYMLDLLHQNYPIIG